MSSEVSESPESLESTEFLRAHFLANLPDSPGVYRMLNADGKIIYVGKAKILSRRVKSYFQKNHEDDPKTAQMVSQIATVEITLTRTEYEALVLESNLIKAHRPKYNIIFKDDKSYPFVWISEGEFPKVMPYRGRSIKTGKLLGPFPDMQRLRESLSQLQKLFKFRQCDEAMFRHRTRPCLQYQIGRCSAPCVGYITPEAYGQDIQSVSQLLMGRDAQVIQQLKLKMQHCAEHLEFEAASRIRDQIQDLERLRSTQSVLSSQLSDADVIVTQQEGPICVVMLLWVRGGKVLGTRAFWLKGDLENKETLFTLFFEQYYGLGLGKTHIPKLILLEEKRTWPESLQEDPETPIPQLRVPKRGERLEWLKLARLNAQQALNTEIAKWGRGLMQSQALADFLRRDKIPKRIECFDISHTQGHQTVASCVVFNAEGPVKSEYRRFNISGITPGDDYAALSQAISRRYRRLQSENKTFPDIVIIDGGVHQLQQAINAWQLLALPPDVLLMSVSKGESRKAGLETLWIAHEPHPKALSEDDPALHLIQRIRDEAHRFAITAHRKARQKDSLAYKSQKGGG